MEEIDQVGEIDDSDFNFSGWMMYVKDDEIDDEDPLPRSQFTERAKVANQGKSYSLQDGTNRTRVQGTKLANQVLGQTKQKKSQIASTPNPRIKTLSPSQQKTTRMSQTLSNHNTTEVVKVSIKSPKDERSPKSVTVSAASTPVVCSSVLVGSDRKSTTANSRSPASQSKPLGSKSSPTSGERKASVNQSQPKSTRATSVGTRSTTAKTNQTNSSSSKTQAARAGKEVQTSSPGVQSKVVTATKSKPTSKVGTPVNHITVSSPQSCSGKPKTVSEAENTAHASAKSYNLILAAKSNSPSPNKQAVAIKSSQKTISASTQAHRPTSTSIKSTMATEKNSPSSTSGTAKNQLSNVKSTPYKSQNNLFQAIPQKKTTNVEKVMAPSLSHKNDKNRTGSIGEPPSNKSPSIKNAASDNNKMTSISSTGNSKPQGKNVAKPGSTKTLNTELSSQREDMNNSDKIMNISKHGIEDREDSPCIAEVMATTGNEDEEEKPGYYPEKVTEHNEDEDFEDKPDLDTEDISDTELELDTKDNTTNSTCRKRSSPPTNFGVFNKKPKLEVKSTKEMKPANEESKKDDRILPTELNIKEEIENLTYEHMDTASNSTKHVVDKGQVKPSPSQGKPITVSLCDSYVLGSRVQTKPQKTQGKILTNTETLCRKPSVTGDQRLPETTQDKTITRRVVHCFHRAAQTVNTQPQCSSKLLQCFIHIPGLDQPLKPDTTETSTQAESWSEDKQELMYTNTLPTVLRQDIFDAVSVFTTTQLGSRLIKDKECSYGISIGQVTHADVCKSFFKENLFGKSAFHTLQFEGQDGLIDLYFNDEEAFNTAMVQIRKIKIGPQYLPVTFFKALGGKDKDVKNACSFVRATVIFDQNFFSTTFLQYFKAQKWNKPKVEETFSVHNMPGGIPLEFLRHLIPDAITIELDGHDDTAKFTKQGRRLLLGVSRKTGDHIVNLFSQIYINGHRLVITRGRTCEADAPNIKDIKEKQKAYNQCHAPLREIKATARDINSQYDQDKKDKKVRKTDTDEEMILMQVDDVSDVEKVLFERSKAWTGPSTMESARGLLGLKEDLSDISDGSDIGDVGDNLSGTENKMKGSPTLSSTSRRSPQAYRTRNHLSPARQRRRSASASKKVESLGKSVIDSDTHKVYKDGVKIKKPRHRVMDEQGRPIPKQDDLRNLITGHGPQSHTDERYDRREVEVCSSGSVKSGVRHSRSPSPLTVNLNRFKQLVEEKLQILQDKNSTDTVKGGGHGGRRRRRLSQKSAEKKKMKEKPGAEGFCSPSVRRQREGSPFVRRVIRGRSTSPVTSRCRKKSKQDPAHDTGMKERELQGQNLPPAPRGSFTGGKIALVKSGSPLHSKSIKDMGLSRFSPITIEEDVDNVGTQLKDKRDMEQINSVTGISSDTEPCKQQPKQGPSDNLVSVPTTQKEDDKLTNEERDLLQEFVKHLLESKCVTLSSHRGKDNTPNMAALKEVKKEPSVHPPSIPPPIPPPVIPSILEEVPKETISHDESIAKQCADDITSQQQQESFNLHQHHQQPQQQQSLSLQQQQQQCLQEQETQQLNSPSDRAAPPPTSQFTSIASYPPPPLSTQNMAVPNLTPPSQSTQNMFVPNVPPLSLSTQTNVVPNVPPPSLSTQTSVVHYVPPPSLSTQTNVVLNVPPPSLSTHTSVVPSVPPPSLSTQTNVVPNVPPPSLSTKTNVVLNVPPPSMSTQTNVVPNVPPPSLSSQTSVVLNVPPPSLSTQTNVPNVPPPSLSTQTNVPNVPPPSLSSQTMAVPHVPPPSLSNQTNVPHVPPPSLSSQTMAVPHVPPPSLSSQTMVTHNVVPPSLAGQSKLIPPQMHFMRPPLPTFRPAAQPVQPLPFFQNMAANLGHILSNQSQAGNQATNQQLRTSNNGNRTSNNGNNLSFETPLNSHGIFF